MFVAVLIYVDDVIIASDNNEIVADLKSFLGTKFKIKDLGPLMYFLGLEVARSKSGIYLCQQHYALELLRDTRKLGCKTVHTPLDPSSKLSQDEGDLLDDPTLYRRLIGQLIYLTITRPDLCFSVNKLSQFMAHPAPLTYKQHNIYSNTLKGQLDRVFSSPATLHSN